MIEKSKVNLLVYTVKQVGHKCSFMVSGVSAEFSFVFLHNSPAMTS